MPASDIVIKGAREHNLRDVNLRLPRNKLICLTGVSGSGKSSLAFDTLFAEGQRRYIESLSTFARQFLGQMPKPDVDHISGLSPSISISQKSSGANPRSTVGTITEIYDFLRVLYARVGLGHCPKCARPITAQSREQILGHILSLPATTRIAVLAPLVRRQKGEFRDLFQDLLKRGFVRARVDGVVVQLTDSLGLDRQMRHEIEVVVDRIEVGPTARPRLAEAVDLALSLGKGSLVVAIDPASDSPRRPTRDEENGDDAIEEEAGEAPPAGASRDMVLSSEFACTSCGVSFEPPTPQLFSFNSPQGMCMDCLGLGEVYTFDPDRLITAPHLSLAKGCIELLGTWKDLGKWRRHIYQGVSETMERRLGLAEGHLADTPWRDLDPQHQQLWLWGTGDEHITFTWKVGRASQKYGGHFAGLIPELLEKYRSAQSKPLQMKLEEYMRQQHCPGCNGHRLNPQARAVTLTTRNPRFAIPRLSLPELCNLSITDAAEFFSALELTDSQQFIAVEALKEVRGRLGFLANVGLDYLSLNRTAPTLSGGESQRIRLASQIGCGLVGVLYILDEPSIGLHPRDNDKLIATLEDLRDRGNTVVVVEHDEDTMRAADHLIDFGPGPGVHGGYVVAEGEVGDLAASKRSQTGAFLSGKRKISVPERRRLSQATADSAAKTLLVRGARHNNLKNIDVAFPLGAFICVTGVSGSGKSSLVNDVLMEALRRDLNGAEGVPGEHDAIEGIEQLDKVIAIDQSPIGRTPRSNPGTYIKLFDDIRNLFAQLPESKRRGFKPGRFSFNVRGGRCEACEGNGANKLEMDFLADIWVTCPVCQGARFNRETLSVLFKGKSISDVLEMDIQQAMELFDAVPQIHHKLQTLHAVGLDYLKIGQPSPTLSGGEAQRIKLARELVKKSTGRTLYVLDEPTTGLHFADIELLLKVLHSFVDAGNTVLVVEHNLDVIKTADWLIDIGPEGGAGGGQLVFAGTPEQMLAHQTKKSKADHSSHTGVALARYLDDATRTQPKPANRRGAPPEATHIEVRGASQHNLKGVDVRIARDAMTVCCGPSGSGKTSLAMDTIYAEGQRRYVESLSSYARQFVGQAPKPALDHIEGLSPAVAIEQRSGGHSPRSSVGTVTEVYDYLRVLYARLGEPHCPQCERPVGTQTSDQVVDKILAEPEGTKLLLTAPLEIAPGDKYEDLWAELRGNGYVRIRIDGQTYPLETPPTIDRRRKHDVAVVVDRITVHERSRGRIAEAVESSLAMGRGVMQVVHPLEDAPEDRWPTRTHSQHLACETCGRSFDALAPHNFSFNSALGWCTACEGLGTQVGANPASLLRSPELTLAGGAMLLWPSLDVELSRAMLQALSRQTGVPLDVSYQRLSARHRRTLLYGSGEQWIEARWGEGAAARSLKFQFKGLYPALEETSKLAPRLRAQLEHLVGEIECSECGGSRLRDDAAAVRFRGKTLEEVCRTPLGELLGQVDGWKLTARDKKIAGELVREVKNRLTFLVDVGLDYLTLGRAAPTLSGGESQRIRLASQVGSGLCGVLYVLDEPTIGLHPRDNTRLIKALLKLRDLGNTLLVVEHDREVVESADALLDFGPAAGRLGGQIVAQGTPAAVSKQPRSVTGPYLSGAKAIPVPATRRLAAPQAAKPSRARTNGDTTIASRSQQGAQQGAPAGSIRIVGARHNNLKNIDVEIPLGALIAVTGVSGSGKSSLINEILYNQLARTLHRASLVAGAHDTLAGVERINKVIRVDQQPLGNSPSSNPATYTGALELIRQLFAQLPEAKLRGYTARRFSFNVPGGRCDACEGAGEVCIEMHFLPDVWVPCETCRGQRYNPETLAVRYREKSIADVLAMPCEEALALFDNIPKIRRVLQTLCDVGLGYLTLGQSAPTLSGGEAQRVKLAAELARPDTGQTLYLLDEPTTGLHFDDLAKLLEVLHRLVDLGNTVLVIEHNLDVIKTADWVIDIGPEAGIGGGHVVAAGTPEQIVAEFKSAGAKGRKKSAKPDPTGDERSGLYSHTAAALAPVLAAGPVVERKVYSIESADEVRQGDLDLDRVGEDVEMPWETDGRRWHTRDRVARDGSPCRWDGRIVDELERRVHELADSIGVTLSDTNWNHRSVVEVTGEVKSHGWMLHMVTGEKWLVKLKLRTAAKTFQREQLAVDLGLKPLDELVDVQAYGSGPRVKCKNLRGPWQEVQIDAHAWSEIDTPAFWDMVERAVRGFHKLTSRVAQNPEDLMPWKVLGRKWHLARKGFPPGKRPAWEVELLEELIETLSDAAPDAQFLWNNKVLVHQMLPGVATPWATVVTKRLASVELALSGPKGAFQLGRLAGLAADRELSIDQPDRDVVRLRFVEPEHLHQGDLPGFLCEHLEATRGAAVG